VRDAGEVRYLVLAERGVPYLLARVRWPDVAQAISAASPDWIEDAGLFDLPYDASAVTVSFAQAASVAAGWGTQLHAEAAQDATSYIRRMPANWSDPSPSERRTWGIEAVGGRRSRARRPHRLQPLQTRPARSSTVTHVNGPSAATARPAANGHGRVDNVTSGLGKVADERRAGVRVRVVGRAHIRCEQTTVTAGLVDLSERGVQLVLPEAPPLVASGAILGRPFLLEAEIQAARICLDVVGRISWQQSNGTGTHFGVAFGELADDEAEGVQRLLAAAARKGAHR
jgi:hypothetical protein